MSLESNVKKWWKSVTIWLNVALAGLWTFADQITAMLIQSAEYFPQLQPYVPSNLYKVIMVVGVVANIYQRFKTTSAVGK